MDETNKRKIKWEYVQYSIAAAVFFCMFFVHVFVEGVQIPTTAWGVPGAFSGKGIREVYQFIRNMKK